MKNSKPKQWSGKSRGGSWGYLFFIYLLRLCGIRACYVFLSLVVVYFIPFAPKATAAIWQYNRKIRKQPRIPAAWGVYWHYYRFGQVLIDKVAVQSGMQDKYRFDFKQYDCFLEILNSAQGVVIIGAHVGAWEMGAGFFGEYAKKLNIVMYDAEYEKIKEVLQAHASDAGFGVIPVNSHSIESILRIKNALDAGEYVCFQGDRYIDSDKTFTLDFMGAEARFPSGPFTVAAKMKKPVVFYYAVREKGRNYKFEFTVINPEQKHSARQLAEYYVRSLEEVVSKHPRQWFNFYKFWS